MPLMDPHTLDKLDFQQIRELLATYARCSLGRERALRISPSHDANEVRSWLEQLRQFHDLVTQRGMPPFAGVRDVRERVRRAVPGSPLEPADYAAIGETLQGLTDLWKYFVDLPAAYDRIAPLVDRLGDFSLIAARIDRAVDGRGEVRDDASDRLRRIRIDVARTLEEVRRVFDRLIRQPEVLKRLQYPNATFHDDRMVLPLRSDQRGRIAGIVHRSSDTGQTLFVEPAEAVALNNALIDLRRDEAREIGRILWQLAHLIHANEAQIQRGLGSAALIDLNIAKVLYARAFDMTVPAVNDRKALRYSAARHPLLLAMQPGSGVRGPGPGEIARTETNPQSAMPNPQSAVVPINLRLGDDFDMLIITGPNTGGKTAALKTAGLLTLMAQAGLAIPAAAGATLPVFDDVLIDVGDEQSLQQSLSTFSAHLARILDVLARAGPRTLVLLDELGAGTDPDEGGALGLAILDELLRRGCLTFVTTHIGILKAVAFQRDRAENGAVKFDVETLRPTYELLIGEPGESNALRIAQRLGMPWQIIRQAEEQLSGQERTLSKAIAGTLEMRRKSEEARRAAEEAERQAVVQADALRRQQAELEQQTRRFARWAERIKALQPGDRVRLKRFDREGVVVRIKPAHQQAVVTIGAMEYEVPFTEIETGE